MFEDWRTGIGTKSKMKPFAEICQPCLLTHSVFLCLGKLKTEINLFVPPPDIYKDMNIRVSKSDAGKVNVSKRNNQH